MRQRMGAVAALFFCASMFGIALSPSRAQTPQTPGTTYCVPATLPPASLGSTSTVNAAILKAASCPGNPGDLWTDGPLAPPAPTYNGSSFTFTVPAMTWYVKGGTVRTPSQTLGPVGTSSTSYWWLDAATGAFTGTTLNVAPTSTADLEYTVTANISGITGIMSQPQASMKIPGGITLGTPLPPSSGGLGPSPSIAPTGCGASPDRSGASGSDVIKVPAGCVASVTTPAPASSSVINPIHIAGSLPNPTVDCSSIPFACAVVIQATAYGVVGDNATDNSVAEQNAFNAACNISGSGLGGVIVQFPTGRIKNNSPVSIPCSTVKARGYGMGYGGGSGTYPTAIAPATTIVCGASMGAAMWTVGPTTAVEQNGNAVLDMGFDGASDLCQNGLAVTGQFEFTADSLSFMGFSGIGFHVYGGQIGGSAKGSVAHSAFRNLQGSFNQPGDGVAFQFDAVQIAGVDWGDVFSSMGTNIHCVYYAMPCIVVGRSDHIELDNLQSNSTAGATSLWGMEVICGAEGDVLGGNVLGQVDIVPINAPSGNPTPTTCSGSWNSPHGISLRNIQTYSNGAVGPGIANCTNVRQDDDHGNIFLGGAACPSPSPGATQAPLYECFGIQDPGGSSCQKGMPVVWADPNNTGNFANLPFDIGTRGAHGSYCSPIEFSPTGTGNGVNVGSFDSYIGCSQAGALMFPSSASYYGAASGNVAGTFSATTFQQSSIGNAQCVYVVSSGNFSGKGCLTVFATPPASSSFDSGSLGVTDTIGCCKSNKSPPSPTPSESPATYMYQVSGGQNPTAVTNDYDPGDWKSSPQVIYQWQFNNQGTRTTAAQLNRAGTWTLPGGSVNLTAAATPANPTPTCVSGGTQADHVRYFEIFGVNGNGTTVATVEFSIDCPVNQVAQMPPPTPVNGIAEWGLCSSLSSGTEQLETSGQNMSLTTTWTEPNGGLSPSGACPATDSSAGGIQGSGKLATTGRISAGSISDSGLSSSSFVCTNSATPPVLTTTGCSPSPTPSSAPTPTWSTTGNQSVTTSTTTDTFVQVGSTLSGTTGISANGWHYTIEMPMTMAAVTTNQFSYGCIRLSATGLAILDSTVWSSSLICKASPGGAGTTIAGSQGFGDSSNGGGQGLEATIHGDGTIPNSTAWSLLCYVATNAASPVATTVQTYCKIRLDPY